MWLAGATDGYAIALPDEDIESVQELAAIFEAPWVVVVDERGRVSRGALERRRPHLSGCRADAARQPPHGEAWLFELAETCGTL